MNFTRDLHLCGTCKKIFSDLNFFLEHKSQCPLPHDSVTFSPNPHDITLENGLFCNETVLDLTVLDSGSFLPILHCENEEVVSDAAELQPQEVVSDAAELQSQEDIFHQCLPDKTRDREERLTSDQVSKRVNEKGVSDLLSTELTTGTVNNSAAHHTTLRAQKKHTRKSLNSEYVSRNGNSEVENEQRENAGEKITAKQSKTNICKICNFVSVYHKDLVRHMRKHTGERPYMCSVCDKKFARQDKLTTHKRIHIGDKRYKCQLCEYAATDSGALKKHSRIHTDERPHRCQMCSYRARSASHMTVHLRTHTGDSPFFCQFDTCEKTFKTSTDLKRHLKVHKLDSLSPSYSLFDGGTGKYSCKHVLKNGKVVMKSPSCLICQDFTNKGVTKRNRGSSRKRGALALCGQPHKCSFCRASFVRPDSLRSHLKLHPLDTLLAHGNAESESSGSPKPCSEMRESPSPAFLLSASEPQDLPQDTENIDSSFL